MARFITLTANTRDLQSYANVGLYHTGYLDSITVEEGIVQGYNDDHNTGYTYDDFEWSYDMDAVHKQVAEFVAGRIAQTDAVRRATVQTYGSPKEYNYTDDWATLRVTYDADIVKQYAQDNPEEFKKFLTDSHWGDYIDRQRSDARHYNKRRFNAEDNRIQGEQVAQLDFYLLHHVPDYQKDDVDYNLIQTVEDALYENTSYELKKGH